MTWVRASYNFDIGMGLFSISQRELMLMRIDLTQVKDGETSGLELVLRELVLRARPELYGCSIYYMGFDPTMNAWQIGVIHPLLPKRSESHHIETLRLFPHKPAMAELTA